MQVDGQVVGEGLPGTSTAVKGLQRRDPEPTDAIVVDEQVEGGQPETSTAVEGLQRRDPEPMDAMADYASKNNTLLF